MDHLTNNYSTAQCLQAAGIEADTLQNWLRAGVIVGNNPGDITGGGTQGRQRRYSFYAVMQIAIAKALMDASGGMGLKRAFEAAMHFAHLGDAPALYADDGLRDNDPDRQPSHPFDYRLGETFFAVAPTREAVVLIPPDGKFDLIRSAIDPNGMARMVGFVVIDAGEVFARVCAVLGFSARALIEEIYNEAVTA